MKLKNQIIFVFLSILALGVLQKWVMPQLNSYYLQILNMIGIAAIMAISLNLVTGHTGQFSLGHAGFMALGAYSSAAVTYYFKPMIPDSFEAGLFLVALVIGGGIAAIAGLMIGFPTLRLKGDYLAIVTLGLGEIIRVIVLNLDFVGGARGFTDIPEYSDFFWIYSILLLTVLFCSRLVYSMKGLGFLAVREDEIAAQSVGISTTRYKVSAFVISSFLAGVGGGLFAHLNTYLHTNSFGFLKSVEYVVMVVLGGMGSMTGSLLSAAALTILPELLRIASEWRMIFYSLLLIVMMIIWPRGLMGKKEWSLLKKWGSQK